VGNVLKADPYGAIHYQWYEPPSPEEVDGAYLPCWWDGSEAYRSALPTHAAHAPHASEQSGLVLSQRTLIIHTFDLDENYRLPKSLLESCSDNTAIWWDKS
jgi:hypothetical protein